MSDEPFGGASGDPIALLQQLIGHVAGLKREMGEFREELQEVRGEIQEVRAELKQEIQELRTELKQEIQEVRAELKQEIHETRTDLRRELLSTRQDMGVRLEGIRTDVRQFLEGTGKREEALRTWLEEGFERKSYLFTERLRDEWEPRIVEMERRLYLLEEAEYQRKQAQKP